MKLIRGLFAIGLVFCIAGVSRVNAKIVSAELVMDVTGSKSKDIAVVLNGAEIGRLPVSGDAWLKSAKILIPKSCLGSIATINSIFIANRPKNFFKIKNVYLKIRDSKGNAIKSSVFDRAISSYETSNFGEGWNYKNPVTGSRSRYLGKPLAVFSLTLPSNKLGYIKQPVFHYKNAFSPEAEKGKEWWKRVERIALKNTQQRTFILTRLHVIKALPKEFIVDQLERYNASRICVVYRDYKYEAAKMTEKLQWLRKQGYLVDMLFTMRTSNIRIPGSKEYDAYIEHVKKVAKNVDAIGADEWFLSPSITKTQGGTVTNLDPEFLDAFKKYSGYSDADVVWAFKNWRTSDPRALKAWEFCGKVQNDIASEFVRAAKQSNPKVKTWISYTGHNWNKLVTTIDVAVQDFDEILDCQTYWYGRFSGEDSFNSSTLTAPIGLGKIEKFEYPDKFSWMGVDPGYTGKKSPENKINSWQKSFYHNSPEEVVPYLATLYAASDGVFVQSPFFANVPDKGTTDEFADMVRLVSNLVPYVRKPVKSDIAYYYDPQATWEITRRENRWWAARETNRIVLGFIQQFCNVDVTSDVKNYKNVIVAGGLLPSNLDYKNQNIYFLGTPEFNEKGEKVKKDELAKLGLKGFAPTGKNFKPADDLYYNENGCTDYFSISGDVQVDKDLGLAWEILGAEIPLRTLCYENNKKVKHTIGSQNKQGNIRVNSMWPSFLHQDTMRKVLKKDLDYFGWTKRDCPQINGKKDIVAVAFREPRTAVLDFGNDVSYGKVKIVIFNGRDGVTWNETVKYQRKMKITLPPLNVLVATGIN